MTEHMAFYGKGGVGKSTIVSNISAALTEAGFKIVQVGCDSDGNSCTMLNGGRPIPTVSELFRAGVPVSSHDVVHYGYKNVATLEIGAPKNDCSRAEGFGRIFEFIERERIIEDMKADYVLYDISGESHFSAFHELLGTKESARMYVVSTADFMSLNKANSIFESLERTGKARVPFGGLIPNFISNTFENSFIADFAGNTFAPLLGRIPRSLMVRQCELYGKTVIEAAPLSNQSYFYRKLANQIVDISLAPPVKKQPKHMPPDRLQKWAQEWADRLYALENGLVSDGEAI